MDNFSEIKQYVTDIKTDQIADKTNFAFQFEILGEGNGIFYIAYRNDNLSIEPYDYYDNSARIQASADIITGLMQGRITINETIRLGDINIISNVSDGVKKVISFFDACYNSQESSDYNSTNKSNGLVLKSHNPWENLRVYIENADIDEESKNQLLANLVKFMSKELHILIVGGCGCGKSSTINALFNMEIAEVGYGVDAETQQVSAYKLDNLYLHDTPGIGESSTADKKHIENIKAALQEVDSDGNAVIDVVLVIVDGSNRDMRSSFELINEVVIPNLHNKDRILVGINRCDLALDGKGWIEKYNYPNEELLQRLKEKSDSVRRRIKEDTGVDVEPIFYSALYKYNISKLLSHLVKSAPTRKRIFFAEKINKNPDNFLRDDTMSLVKKNTVQERADRWPQGWYRNNLYNSSNQNNVYDSNADKIYEEVTHIKSQMSGIERKIETIHTDIKLQAETIPSTAQEETDDDMESEYELIKTDETQYKEEFQSSMEEAFEAASTELNEESKEKIKFSFVDMLDDMKTGIIKGAEAGIELGKRVPFISATVGSAIGAVLGGVGGFLTNVFKKKK
jgi:hypothetical protein